MPEEASRPAGPLAPDDEAPASATRAQRDAPCTLVERGYGVAGNVTVRVEEVVDGLEVPWSIAFLPDGDLLVTERAGRIRLVRGGRLEPRPVAVVDTVAALEEESGLLGLAVHPEVAENRLFYIYYTARVRGRRINRVERWMLAEDGRSAIRERIILDDIPGAQYHDGGRLRFGPDGMLYIGTGDARTPEAAQDVRSLAGKILRLDPEGRIPADNPFRGSATFIRGIRNTQGFDWISRTTLLVTDHGPTGEFDRSGHDEVTVARAGDNLGWPTIYGCQSRSEMVAPALTFRTAVPPAGAAIYRGSAIPEWRGSLLVGTLRSEHLHRVVLTGEDPAGQVRHEVYLQGQFGRLRDVIMSPDGDLYLTTSNCDGRGRCPADRDKILRVTR
jgi:glucose/arabinose dehydrogenase